jgi:GNAT superfamily N-acetyltransferase
MPIIRQLTPADTGIIGQLADWYHTEWAVPRETTLERLTGHPSNDILVHLIVMEKDQLVASAGVHVNVGIIKVYQRLEVLKPWLSLVYTAPSFRNQGFASILLDEVERAAINVGITHLSLYTYTAEGLYRKKGWTEVERVVYKDHENVVMRKDLRGPLAGSR